MNDSSQSQPIETLIERYYLDPQSLDENERTRLITALKEDRAARDRFRGAAHIDAELRYLASGEEPLSASPLPSHGVRTFQWKWALAIAASLLLIAAITYQNWPPRQPMERPPIAEQEKPSRDGTSNVIATLGVGHNQRFEEAFAPHGNAFQAGEYHLSAGEITLAFNNGVAVSIESPAQFSIVDPMHMHLRFGRARAIVPEAGHGFVIETSKLVVEDLGTEFGVFVDHDQSQELHVFAGEVRLKEEHLPSELLTENWAIAWNAGDPRQFITADDSAFATSTSIGYKCWLDQSQRLREDPSALFYFDFETDSRQSDQVTNCAPAGVVADGFLHGGIWATGRWPEKGAMLFENPGDRIELDIPGQYEQITIMAWVQMNRYDFPLQTLFNTVDYNSGQHHWNLMRDGALRVGVSGQYALTTSDTLSRNRWTHVAAQLDSVMGKSTYYINGQEVARIDWSTHEPLHFGASSIGAYGFTNKDGKVIYCRDLRGRVDEFAMFSRILSVQEIQEAYEAGNNFQ